MKKIIILLSLFVSMTSCMNNDYLEKLPLDKQTEESTFNSYSGFKTYSWGLYEVFDGYKNIGVLYDPECNADNMFVGTKNSECRWAWNKVIVPTSDEKNAGGWNYNFIRKVNVMLDRIDGSEMTKDEKAHWRAVGLFFRSFRYADLMNKYGDVVWIENSLNEVSPELYAPRDSRDKVADNILRDLLFARDNIKKDGDGKNTINRDVVNAFISRFGLAEGTWRRYHGLKNDEKFLQESKVASEELIKKFPNLHPNYDEIFNSTDLVGTTGVLLARQYVTGLQGHMVTRLLMSSSSRYEMCKDAVDSYLCSDGMTIAKSPLFEGDKSPYTEFRHRDLRLLFTTCPPYKISTPPSAFEQEWWPTGNPADAEYFSVMNSISKEGFKLLPIRQNGNSVLKFYPHFTKHNGGFGFQVAEGGYWVYKHINHHESYPVNDCGSDAPIFRMGEVM
ncbi:MAG: RagB/SusD family nutrient uptake outer membrane protein, partial [Rikenellaceae bacterium]